VLQIRTPSRHGQCSLRRWTRNCLRSFQLSIWEPTEEFDTDSAGTEAAADGEYGVPESSHWAAARQTARASSRRCAACQEHVRFFDMARVPCSPEYCRDCLQDLFRASMTDDSLFPPRCCRQPITTGSVRVFLTAELVMQYEQKKIELDTPGRTYCSNPLCSAFIRLEDITDEQASCPDCGTVTCTLCKATSHGRDCPADTSLQQVLQTADENGWQRCYSCRRLVELDIGCNHISQTNFQSRFEDSEVLAKTIRFQETPRRLFVFQTISPTLPT
jgi:hypothetical protein